MSFRQFRDGQLHERPLGARGRVEFPLLVNPLTADGYARTITRRVLVDPAHFRPRLPQRTSYTNLLPYSSDFGEWTESGTVTRTAAAFSNPLVSLDLLGGSGSFSQEFVPPASGSYFVSIIVKRGVTPGRSVIGMIDDSMVPASSLYGIIEQTAALPVFSASTGSLYAVESLPDGCHRLTFQTAPISPSATHTLSVIPIASFSPACDLYAGGVQISPIFSPAIETLSAARTVSAPDVDSIANAGRWPDLDPYAHLVWESPEPEDVGGGRWAVTRRYARIPRTTYEPRSELADLPSLHDVTDGTHYGVSWDQGRTSWIFSSRKTVSSIQSLAAATATVSGTSNTTPPELPVVMITFKGSAGPEYEFSTYNGAGDIADRFRVRGFNDAGCVRTNFRIEITWAGSARLSYAQPSVDNAVRLSCTSNSFVIEPASTSGVTTESETTTVPESLREFTLSASHGVSVGDRVAFYAGARIVALSTVAKVVDSDTFAVPLKDVDGKDFSATDVVFASQAAMRIVNGVADCSARLVRRFYLPGVSMTATGTTLATVQDIPAFAAVFDPVSWLGVVVAYAAAPSPSTYAIKSVEALTSFDGLILEKSVVEIQVQDAYRTISVTA